MSLQNFKDLGKRLIVAFIAIAITSLLIIFSENTVTKVILALFVSFLSFMAIKEYIGMAEKKNLLLSKKILFFASLIIPICFFLSSQRHSITLIFFSYFLFIALLFYVRFKRIENSLVSIAASSFGLFYITLPLGLIFLILYGPEGKLWLAYLLLVTKITDIGGYFGGKAFGKRPLSLVSPKKTIEGAISGFICAIALSYFFTIYTNSFGFSLKPSLAILSGAILGIFGQIGDLAESLLKRDASIKDSANIPGMGGVLDMLDSLLFNIPLTYCLIEAFG